MNERSSTILLIVLLAVMTCLPLLYSGYTTNDDVYITLGVQEGKRMSGIGDAEHSGRLQHVVTGFLMPLNYGWGHYWVMKSLSLAAILGSVAAMFVALRVLTQSVRFAALAVVFFFAFAQNTYDSNLLTAYPFVLSAALTALWLSVASWWLALQGWRRLRLVSLALFACGLLVYETFIVYAIVFPVLTAAARGGTWADRARHAARTPHVLMTIVFLGAVLAFRIWVQSQEWRETMAVEQYVINLDVRRIGKVLERYAASAFPLHYSRTYRPMVTDFYMGFGTFRVKLFEIFEVIEAAWLVKALIVAFLTAALTTGRDRVVRHRGVLWVVALVFVVLSNLPLALSAKYQTWVIESSSQGYLTSYFVFFGVVILLALLLDGSVSWLSRRSRRSSQVLGGVFALAAFFVCYGTDLINAHVAFTERQMYDRWKTVDAWIASPAFQAIPDGSLILAPSLFEHYPGTTHVFDDYWTRYVRHHGGKRVEMLHTRSDWAERARAPEAADNLYFLQLTQERRGDASYLVFGRVAPGRENAALASRDVAILAHAKSDHFRIMGRLLGVNAACRARVFVDGVPTNGTFTDRFGAHVDRVRNAQEWLWTRLSSDAAIDPESLLVTASEVPVDGSLDVRYGAGFHLDEVAYRWSEAKAAVILRNRQDRSVRVNVEFEVQAPGLPAGARARLHASAGSVKAQWEIGPDYGKHSMRIEIPPESSTDLLFTTDAPRINAPLDSRTLVLRFLPSFRALEAGCEEQSSTSRTATSE